MNNATNSQTTTPEQRFAIGFFVFDSIAQTTMVFLRRGIGMRALHERTLVALALVLFFMCNPLNDASFDATPTSDGMSLSVPSSILPLDRAYRPGCLGVFACFVIFMTGFHKQRRRLELKQGIVSHTYSRGVSVFAFLPVNPTTLARIVDPAVAIGIGFLSWHFLSTALGVWLIFSGCALAMVERVIQLWASEITLDTLDGLVESKQHSESLSPFVTHSTKPQRDDNSHSIPTGLAPDVEAHIKARHASRRPTPPKH